MIQELLNIIFILTYVHLPSYTTGIYALIGLYLWIACTFLNSSRKFLYELSCIASIVISLLKLLTILHGYLSFLPEIYTYYKDYLNVLGVNLEYDSQSVLFTFLPEICIFVVGILGWILPINALLWVNQRSVKYLGLVILWIMCCSEFSVQGIVYNALILYWAIEAGLFFSSPDFKTIGKVISVLTTMQIFLALAPESIHNWLGYLEKYTWEYIIMCVGQVIFSAMSREEFEIQKHIDKNVFSEQTSSKEKALIYIIYFLGKICLFLWVDLNPGLTGLLLIIWFAFTLLEKSINVSMRLMKYLLVPILTLSYISSYLSIFWTQPQSFINFFMLFTVLLFSFLHRQSPKIKNIEYSVPDTWYGRIVSEVISHAYLLSLTVLFIIGLSAINILHTGMMTICLMFMANVKSVQKRWEILSIYITTTLFLQETWSLAIPFFPDYFVHHKAWELVGLNNEKQEFAGIKYDYLIWIQVFCCGLQQFANNYITRDVAFEYTSTLFRLFGYAYQYFLHFQLWLLYSVILLLTYLDAANILNLIRLVLILWILTKHLSNPERTINMNFAHITWHLKLLQYYNVILIACRYLYQFLGYFFDTQDLEFSLIGLGVYGKTELYSRTSTDTMILVCSVLAHRFNMTWAAEHNDKGFRDENPELTVSFIGNDQGGNNYLYVFFYNFLSRPFEYIVFLIVGYMCFYWRFSLSTFGYLFFMGIYQFRVSHFFYKYIKKESYNIDKIKKKEWKYRAKNWRIMFGFTIFTLFMVYARYLVGSKIVHKDYYDYIEAICFIIGYHNEKTPILTEMYGFLVVFMVLAIERHCLQFIIPEVCKKEDNGWEFRVKESMKESIKESDQGILERSDSGNQDNEHELARSNARSPLLVRKLTTRPEFMQTKEYFTKKINYISVLALIKLIVETLLPMFLLLLAFYRISVFSILYVLFVFIQSFFNKFGRAAILNYMLIISTWIEYLTIIANLNSQWFEVPDTLSKIFIPIGDNFVNMNDETKKFFFFKLTLEESQWIFRNILFQLLILIYYFHFSMRELQLDGLQKVLAQVRRNEKPSLSSASSFKLKFRAIMFYLKNLFYKFARFSIVLIVLVFITQSKGVLSSLYCLFCIVFLIQENSIYVSSDKSFDSSQAGLTQRLIEKNDYGKKGITFYTFLLGLFLQLISIDLVLQITIQIPYVVINEENNSTEDDWFGVFGLFKLYDENNSAKETQYKNVYFKIFTFAILMLVQSMMKSRDFLDNHRKQCETIAKESEQISRDMTHEFNRQRITMHKKSVDQRESLEANVRELERQIDSWNKRFNGSSKRIRNSLKMFPVQTELKANWDNEKPASQSSAITQALVKLINPCLFKSFLSKIRRIVKENSEIEDNEIMLHKSKTVNDKIKAKHDINRPRSLFATYDYDENPLVEEKIENPIQNLSPDNEDTQFSPDKQNIHISPDEQNIHISPDEQNINVSPDKPNIYISPDKEEMQFSPEKDNILINEEIYDVRWSDYHKLICYVFASNTQAIVYFLFFVNHYIYASLESIVFPLSVLGYAMLEFPRPRIQFFRFMLYYAGLIVFVKYALQLEIWRKIDKNFLLDYEDPIRFGFNLAKNTYSDTLLNYVIWDVLVMFSLLCHEYYMLRIGMYYVIETDIETFEEGRSRIEGREHNASDAKDKKSKSFLRRLMPRNTAEKPGKDLYLFTFLMQLIILIYLFICFNSIDGFSQDIYMSIVSNQFQGRMVVSLLIVVILMLYDRYVYLKHTAVTIQSSKGIENDYNTLVRKSKASVDASVEDPQENFKQEEEKEKENLRHMFGMQTIQIDMHGARKQQDEAINHILLVKLILHGTLLIGVHFVIFWYFPGSSNKVYCSSSKNETSCNDFTTNIFLRIFYILYVLYLIFEAQQISFGLPNFTEISFPLMRHIGPYTSSLFKFYRGAPFLFELRTVIDWTFTKTGLDIFQWFKFEDIQANLFTNQCTQKSISYREKGAHVLIMEKCIYGACALVIMLLIILLPLMIFSTMNPIVEMNKVTSVSMSVKILIGNRSYRLYSLSTADTINDVDEATFNSRTFNSSSELRAEDWKIMQQINMPDSADSNWDISGPSKKDFKNSLLKVINYTDDEMPSFDLVLEYKFTRKYPLKTPVVSKENLYPLNQTHALLLYNRIFENTNENLTLSRVVYKVLRLPSAGDQIQIYEYKKDDYRRDLVLELGEDDIGKYWKVMTKSIHDGDVGLRFYVISDTFSPMTFNFSIITFYISIVYLAGRLIRVITYGSGMNCVMTDMKNAATLNTLCVAVYVSRMIGKISKEQEFYFELIDILRSPELIKKLTGSSSIKVKQD
ncbi:hypothetical protein SteCoe_17020 [Stentor coeruleus]|uniref:Uncharacterized protein n=1 Tax=Stentor coeruleus TaxID=5963 RepID=A0A1R2BZX2_9CILI|nr:hypothetical protein SteCoe_17020 [Stentor coeruleus]